MTHRAAPTRRRCYRTAPDLPEQARRVIASLRAHPGRALAHYALPPALERLVRQHLQADQWREEP